MIEDTNKTSAIADNRDGITVPWVFLAHPSYHFTVPEILSLVDGLNEAKLWAVFHDAHIEGKALAEFFNSRTPRPCTLRPEFAAFIRDKLARAGKTVATLKEPGVFIISAMREFHATARRAEEDRERQRKKDWLRYVTLLRRLDDRQEGDTEDLARVMESLDRTSERVKEDLLIVCTAKNLIEQRDIFQRLSAANDRLQVLSRQHPEFFACPGMAPSLLSEPVPARKAAPKPAAATIGDTGTSAPASDSDAN